MAEDFDTGTYIEGVRELMSAYNESGDDELYRALHELCYAPNEAALRDNYAKNAALYAAAYDDPVLPTYDELPIRLFPLTSDYSVLFDQEQGKFLLNVQETGLQYLYHELIFAEELEDPVLSEARYSHVLRQERGAQIRTLVADAVREEKYGKKIKDAAEAYHAFNPYDELYEMYYAEEELRCGRIDEALRYAQKAYAKRKTNTAVCHLLSRIYRAGGYLAQAIKFQVLSAETSQLSLPDDPVQLQHCLHAITAADTDMRYAPFVHRTSFEEGGIKSSFVVPIAEEILRFSDDSPRCWAGIYNPYGQMNVKEKLLAVMNRAMEQNALSVYSDFTFDLMKAEEHAEIQIALQENTPVLVPIAAKETQQRVCFYEQNCERSMKLSKAEFGFYRIEHPTRICSDALLAVGEPILLSHSPMRRKFVLNILADGFSWSEMRRQQYSLVPNLMKFFQKGVIFDNQFSTAEYTYPALATIETGMYQHHTQITEPGAAFVLDPSYVTISEKMKSLGYYCVMLEGCSDGVYNGAFRGYDRLLVNPWVLRAADGVERMIRHLEAFGECDNFVFLHFADTHPNNFDVAPPVKAQTQLSLADALQPQDLGASVFLKPNPFSQYVNRSEVQAADRQLGYLFDYIEQHYEEDEYIVLLYSDHGASVYARSPYLLSEEQTGAALMARGAGVPALGRVDELTSSVDIYKILGKLAGYPIDAAYLDGNLPEAFGGQRREYTVSNSIYPGQTYKICVRTERHAFHLETEELTREDGTISLDRYTYHIHERSESYREVFDDALTRYFMDIVRRYTESFRR